MNALYACIIATPFILILAIWIVLYNARKTVRRADAALSAHLRRHYENQ